MRTVNFEHMRPDEILQARKNKDIVYLPVGPLEWHGPALPFGTDPMFAHYIGCRVAEKIGGIVMPAVYCGTERERSKETLEAMGFTDTDQYIVGQDFPDNSIRSLYSKQDRFALIIREYLELLIRQGFRLIVILNGHGAVNQLYELERLCIELSNESTSKVISVMSFVSAEGYEEADGHANIGETSGQMYTNAEDVDLSLLPDRSIPLKSNEWGINDGYTYALRPNKEKTVQGDPRDANAQIGLRIVERTLEHVCRIVEEAYSSIKTV